MIRFVLQSYVFKGVLIITLIFSTVIFVANRSFDNIWGSSVEVALVDMNDVYTPPKEYDNLKRINVSYIPEQKICIEGNRKIRLLNYSQFSFFDTVHIDFPTDKHECLNRIFFQFDGSNTIDSMLLVVTKSIEPGKYWKQIFLSSVIVSKLNQVGIDTNEFRLDYSKIVDGPLLKDNDTLISQALNYFNSNKDTMKLTECGVISMIFMSICEKFNLPCRTIYLQGGDVDVGGYNNQVGYPSHMICEVYSSKYRKWYVIDPTYGFRFKSSKEGDYMNAAEISNSYFFNREKDIYQDSILFTKRTILGRDYFKYYENVAYETNYNPNYILAKILGHFYKKFNYGSFLCSNNTPFFQDATNYMIAKSVMYLMLIALYFNAILFVILRRLMQVKKPKII